MTANGIRARAWIRDFNDDETASLGMGIVTYRATSENIMEMAISLLGVFPLLYVDRRCMVSHTSEIVNPKANSSRNEPDGAC